MELLLRFEAWKRQKYEAYCRDHLDSDFQPFIISHDGALSPAATEVVKELARRLSATHRWAGKPAGAAMRWLCAYLQLGALKHSSMCLRTSRFKWRSVEIEDGAAYDYLIYRDD
jgi:hypothetical protein